VSDLASAIIAKYDAEHEDAYWLGRAILEAVLEHHKPIEGSHHKPIVCGCAIEPDDPYTAWEYPCPTVKAIAKALGIGVGDD
jgi:hypothetical protein